LKKFIRPDFKPGVVERDHYGKLTSISFPIPGPFLSKKVLKSIYKKHPDDKAEVTLLVREYRTKAERVHKKMVSRFCRIINRSKGVVKP
jgi:hypothetical protein